ncbi:hypothetical protein BJX64DRAFT_134083 [Aspergillus heterothallicus]
MERLHSRVPYAQWRLQVFRQLFTSSNASHSSSETRRIYSTTPDKNKNQQRVNGQNRNNDKPETSKRPSELLPQSPLVTHPRFGPAIRHQKKSQPTTADLGRLAENPWAVALASPVRHCALSGARIPKAFLTDWGAVVGPDETLTPTPTSTPVPDRARVSEQTPKPVSVEDTKPKPLSNSHIWLLPVGLLEDKLKGLESRGRQTLRLRMINRMSVFQRMEPFIKRKRGQKRPPSALLIPNRWKIGLGGPWSQRDDERLFWRPDMPEFVRWAHRSYAINCLRRASGTASRHDPSYGVWKPINVQAPYSEEALVKGLKDVAPFERMGDGVVLVLGNGNSTTSLPEYVTVPTLERKVPVLVFTRLFSETELEGIREYDPRFQEFALFFRPSNHWSIEAVLALWKLHGYVRESS